MKRMAAFFLFFACLQTVNVYANTSRDVTAVLGDLEKTMSGTKTIQADFIQEKDLALFNQKIIIKGKVFIRKPGFLSWKIVSPMRYSMVMKDSTISQWDEDTDQVQRVSLANNPGFQLVVEQMERWFCGAYRSMLDEYKITQIAEHPLALEFVPLEGSAPHNFIERVTIFFQDDERYISEVRIEEKGGDSTSLIFSNTQLNQPITPSAWEVRTNVR
jgi:outer membrane lipoprotein-sorting protein